MNLPKAVALTTPRKRRKRIGRGYGSGNGVTAGRGTKGYKSRSGSKLRLGFEGGQMPLFRRLPKRGFNNPFRQEYAVVNVSDLNQFEDGASVDVEKLRAVGMARPKTLPVKVLGNGELERKLVVEVHKFSKSAAEKIAAAGGQALPIPPPRKGPARQ